MKIWVDADACPVVIREILYRAAERTGIKMTLVTNQSYGIPDSKYIDRLTVSGGFDAADDEILKGLGKSDLVITNDIPLAAEVVHRGGIALSTRGVLFSDDNVRDLLNRRNILDTLRDSGIITGGPPPLNHSDRKAFANQLDRLLTRMKNSQPLS